MAKKGTGKKKDDVKSVEKALRVGMGLISLGGEKVSDLMDELAKRGSRYADKTDSAISKLGSSLAEKKKVLKEKSSGASDWISKEVKMVINRVNFATREEVEKLRAEVADLKKLVGKKIGKKAAKKKTAKKKPAKKKAKKG